MYATANCAVREPLNNTQDSGKLSIGGCLFANLQCMLQTARDNGRRSAERVSQSLCQLYCVAIYGEDDALRSELWLFSQVSEDDYATFSR